MLRNILLPTILALLAYGFWISQDFKAIAAGLALFMFGMLSLDEVVIELTQNDHKLNTSLDTLIRGDRLSQAQATSLMNPIGYPRHLSDNGRYGQDIVRYTPPGAG